MRPHPELTPEQRARFHAQGWLVLRGALDAAMLDRLQAWAAQLEDWAEMDGPALHHFEQTDAGPKLARSERFIEPHPGLRGFLCEGDLIGWVGALTSERSFDDGEWHRCMETAAGFQLPIQLRSLLSMIVVFNTPDNPARLFEAFSDHLKDDFVRAIRDARGTIHAVEDEAGVCRACVLIDMEDRLRRLKLGTTLEEERLPAVASEEISRVAERFLARARAGDRPDGGGGGQALREEGAFDAADMRRTYTVNA